MSDGILNLIEKFIQIFCNFDVSKKISKREHPGERYIAYALKFVQAGMIFNKPQDDPTESNYEEQLETIKNLDLSIEDNKIKEALEISKGDIQMSIRYMFQSKYDQKLNSTV